jgi:hypothetical protein
MVLTNNPPINCQIAKIIMRGCSTELELLKFVVQVVSNTEEEEEGIDARTLTVNPPQRVSPSPV